MAGVERQNRAIPVRTDGCSESSMRKGTTITRGLVAGLLLAGATYVIGDTVQLWINGPHALTSLQSASYEIVNPFQRDTKNPVVAPEQIEAWRLFGSYQNDALAPDRPIPETEIELKLLGVVDNHVSGDGWAIIQTGGGPPKLFRAGEKINAKVNIKDILSGYVLLQRGRRLERLSLLPWGDTKSVQGVGSLKGNGNAATVEKDTKLEKAHGKLVSSLGLEPVSPGTANGYRLANENGRLAEKYDMKEGDVVVSANGYPLGTFKDDQMAYASVRQSGTGKIVIRRGTDEYRLEYDVRRSRLTGLDVFLK